jgi:ABC-type antimicrobial peptide transport system permease subunit
LIGVLGLVISAVGIYGLMACVVSQRTREIGVRMALGATRSNVIAMVLLNASVLVASGLLAGCCSCPERRSSRASYPHAAPRSSIRCVLRAE